MHVGFTSDQGGNSIDLRWFRHKSNLHHVRNETPTILACTQLHTLHFDDNIYLGRFQVWDREIIQTALAEFYDKDMDTFRKQLEHNLTKVSEGDGCYLRNNWRFPIKEKQTTTISHIGKLNVFFRAHGLTM